MPLFANASSLLILLDSSLPCHKTYKTVACSGVGSIDEWHQILFQILNAAKILILVRLQHLLLLTLNRVDHWIPFQLRTKLPNFLDFPPRRPNELTVIYSITNFSFSGGVNLQNESTKEIAVLSSSVNSSWTIPIISFFCFLIFHSHSSFVT